MDSVVTLWFISTPEPGRVLEAEPKADRGFGRKYLAQLNPTWPITPIGQFPLNRSAQASTGEFYIAGFPGVTVIQTVMEATHRLSELDPHLLGSVPAIDVYAFAVDEETGYGGLAHWHAGELKRSFCAIRHEIFEDTGLPHPFESPYWAGERAEPVGGISLPFKPVDLVAEAQRTWLGVDISPDGPDINVVAYAVDGRPEPKVSEEPPHLRHRDVGELASSAAAKLGLGAGRGDYDDYEDHTTQSPSTRSAELGRLADSSAETARRVGRGLVRRLRSARDYVDEKLRHSDRP